MSTDVFIARTDASKDCEVTIVADNMFNAVLYVLDGIILTIYMNDNNISRYYIINTLLLPINNTEYSYYLDNEVMPTMFNSKEIRAFKKHLVAFANEHNIPLNEFHAKLKARNSRSVCKTFHKAGLVVPFDRKTEVGYRPLIETDGTYFFLRSTYSLIFPWSI